MNLLIDAHALVWFLNGDKRLPESVRDAIEDTENGRFVSIATIWEIAIKTSLGKFHYPGGFKNFLELVDENSFDLLPVSTEHTLLVSSLEFIHRDPFDRLLVAQAMINKLTIVTKDTKIKKNNINTLW